MKYSKVGRVSFGLLASALCATNVRTVGAQIVPVVPENLIPLTAQPIEKPLAILGRFRLNRSEIPRGVTVRGALRGKFAETDKKQSIEKVIDINELNDQNVLIDTNYEFDLIATGETANLYGLTLGNEGKIGTAAQVILGAAAQTIHLRGEIEAAQLLDTAPQLKLALLPQPIRAHRVAKTEDKRDGVSFRGAVSGRFLDFKAGNNDKNRIVSKTLDGLAFKNYGWLGADYVLVTNFQSANAEIYSVALGSQPEENLLRADFDTPQRDVFVQSLIQGARFSSTGLGWGASKTKAASLLPFSEK